MSDIKAYNTLKNKISFSGGVSMVRFLLLLAFVLSSLWSQTITSRIRGVVTDTSGAVVPGAEVTMLHEATGLKRTAPANASGQYSFDAVPLGKYTISVTMQGFKKFSSSGNELQVGEPLTIDVALAPGVVSEEVTVVATSVQVSAESKPSCGLK